MTFETPPRGSGRSSRHRRNESPGGPSYAPGYRAVGDPPEYPASTDYPTDPTMRVPLNEAPAKPVGETTRRITVERAGEPRYQDLIVPRVYVESDGMDELRRRSLRWGIGRDVLVCVTMVYLLASWILPTVTRWLGFG